MKAVPAAFAFVLAGGSAMGACTDVRSLVCTLPMSVSYDPVRNVDSTTHSYTPPPLNKCTSAGVPACARKTPRFLTLTGIYQVEKTGLKHSTSFLKARGC